MQPLASECQAFFQYAKLPFRQSQYEKGGLSIKEKKELALKGHKLKEINRKYGNMQAIMYWKSKNINFVASDPRGEGAAETINSY